MLAASLTRSKPNERRDLYTESVVVKVGPEDNQKAFHVHKGLVMHYSGFFRGAFGSENFQEGASGEVTLEDVEHRTFTIFVDWLYRQTWDHPMNWPALYCVGEEKTMSPGLLLTEAHVFADRFLVPGLKALTLELAADYYDYCHLLTKHTTWRNMVYASKNLPEDSPFLNLLVDAHCAYWGPDSYDAADESQFQELPHKFLMKMMKKFAEMAANDKTLDRKYYKRIASEFYNASDREGQPSRKKQKTTG